MKRLDGGECERKCFLFFGGVRSDEQQPTKLQVSLSFVRVTLQASYPLLQPSFLSLQSFRKRTEKKSYCLQRQTSEQKNTSSIPERASVHSFAEAARKTTAGMQSTPQTQRTQRPPLPLQQRFHRRPSHCQMWSTPCALARVARNDREGRRRQTQCSSPRASAPKDAT